MGEEGSLLSLLLKSLEKSGVKVVISEDDDLTPAAFFSICSQSLRLLNPTTTTTTLIDFEKLYTCSSTAHRFNICSHLASSVSHLGFPLTFHNGKLQLSSFENGLRASSLEIHYISPSIFESEFLYPSEEDFYKILKFFVKKLSELPQHANQVPEKVIPTDVGDTSSNNLTVKSVDNRADLISEDIITTSDQDTVVNPELPESSNFRSQDLRSEEVCYATGEEGLEKLTQLKTVEQEIEAVLSETNKREEELCKLLADVEIQPKVTSSRKSYIQRITEITKNSRKQDSDIERILKDTRELQLESNYIQERLNRTYAVVDETIFREGKKDPAGTEAYRLLLASIHESFEQISNKILSTDRIKRESAEYEAKLSALSRRSFNVEKLHADLDAIKRENEFLERET